MRAQAWVLPPHAPSPRPGRGRPRRLNETALRTATNDLTAAGHQVLGVRCDVSDEVSVAAMMKATVDTPVGTITTRLTNAQSAAPASRSHSDPLWLCPRSVCSPDHSRAADLPIDCLLG